MNEKKLYFVRTNGFDMVVTFDGEVIRMITECYFDRYVSRDRDYPERIEQDALDFLNEIEDDSGYDIVEIEDDETAEQVLEQLIYEPESEILAEIEKAI